LLAEVRGAKCGVAFDEQIASEVPVGMLDVQVNFILTATRCVKVEE
jgi:5-formyltetrahydrofolate cyclo-ligase